MYRVYQTQAAAAYSSLYFFSFLSLQFSNIKIFVALFSGTMRPIKLKLDTHVDIGWMYHVYRSQAAASYLSLISLFFFLSNVQKLKIFSSHFSQELWGLESLKLGTLVDWVDVSCIPESGCCHLFVLYFFIFLSFQLSNFIILCQEVWGLESWNFVHMWIIVACIVYTLGCCCLFVSLSVHFSFSPIFSYKFVFLLW